MILEAIIGKASLLEQLAEEAAELAQASLKLARIIRNENPTPITSEEAYSNLIEEFTDVVQCARELGLVLDEEQIIRKRARWLGRLKSQVLHTL